MNNQIYCVNDIENICTAYGTGVFAKANKKTGYLNTPVSFDIETSSYYNAAGEKRACMYIWAFDIFDCCIIGRTWAEFLYLLDKLTEIFDLDENRRIVIYVHNLAYEFQFMRKWLEWSAVFALDDRKPAYCLTRGGFEFRCSLILSGCKLETLGKELKNKIPKLVGQLNYDLVRHSKSYVSDDEKQYVLHDVKIVSEYIREKIAEENGVCNIPLTKTGYVRRFCRARCLKSKDSRKYSEMIHNLNLSPTEYIYAKDAFTGGFTHANFWYQGKKLYNVKSFDFCSSYPAVMICEKFPMSTGQEIKEMTRAEFENYVDEYCCIFTVTLENVKPLFTQESYISESRCYVCENPVVNNGRIYSADKLILTITNIDYRIIERCYKFNLTQFDHFYIYKAGYLPKKFIECILDLYQKKTTLKGVKGMDDVYNRAKADLNSLYGMCVTDICRDMIIYDKSDSEWIDEKTAKEKGISLKADPEILVPKENDKFGRFLFYLWGVFVTAYSRRNLYSGIFECGKDYVYTDTDSIKILNAEKHMDFINRYNKWVAERCDDCMRYYDLPLESTRPKTKKGKVKQLGAWELDGEYAVFKTLGAKRYLCVYEKGKEPDDCIKIDGKGYLLTVAGLPKDAVCYMVEKFGHNNVFDKFNNQLVIPAENTHKLTHTYIDSENNDTIIDYMGIVGECNEKSFIHLEKAEFSFKISETYKRFLNAFRQIPE